MKELVETIDLMCSDDYKNRFIAEYWQLKIRYEKLKKLCVTIEGIQAYNEGIELGEKFKLREEPKYDCSLSLLRLQLKQMEQLLHTLEVRAVIENIDLEKGEEK